MPPEIIELVRDWEPALLISVALNAWLLWERVSVRKGHADELKETRHQNAEVQRESVRALEAVREALVNLRIDRAREGR